MRKLKFTRWRAEIRRCQTTDNRELAYLRPLKAETRSLRTTSTSIVLAAVILWAARPSAWASPVPRPELIAAAVRVHGAVAVVAALVGNDQWNGLVRRMGAGDADWIAIAPKLAPGTEGGTRISLDLTLAQALPLNAPAVLSVLDPSDGSALAAGAVCATPALSLPAGRLATYEAAAVAAVEQVGVPGLAPARGACLKALTGIRGRPRG